MTSSLFYFGSFTKAYPRVKLRAGKAGNVSERSRDGRNEVDVGGGSFSLKQ